MKTKLILNFEFIASHSLSVREVPHNHLWRIKAVIEGEPQSGMILNMVDVRQHFKKATDLLANTYLNNNPNLPSETNANPTCETLAAHLFTSFGNILDHQFRTQNPSVYLDAIEVELYEPNGYEWGSARLERS